MRDVLELKDKISVKLLFELIQRQAGLMRPLTIIVPGPQSEKPALSLVMGDAIRKDTGNGYGISIYGIDIDQYEARECCINAFNWLLAGYGVAPQFKGDELMREDITDTSYHLWLTDTATARVANEIKTAILEKNGRP